MANSAGAMMTTPPPPDDLPADDLPANDLQERLRSHLEEIARERDPYLATAGHFYVQTYIQQQLQQFGTVERHDFTYNPQGRSHQNLILNLPAQTGRESKPPIVIGAHYDAVPGTPGADDNASGVAVLLELARAIAQQPLRFPLRLIAFDLEEFGMVGSTAYAQDLVTQQQAIRLMLSLEMLGYCSQEPNSQQYPAGLERFYPDRGNFIGVIGNLPTLLDMQHFSRHFRRTGVPAEWLPAGMKGQLVRATRLSDHAPFWDRGYRAMMITDTAFMRNPHYHQPSDRLETLDLSFMTHVCLGILSGLQTLR
jgi:Zn-dependent M28 family amino/carboxypeptidase